MIKLFKESNKWHHLFNLLFLIMLHCSMLAFGQVNLTNGLMAYYPFNGNVKDLSGNGNNPIFNNTTLTTDRFGNPNSACLFDGNSSYVQIPNSPTLNANNTLTMSAWVKANGFYPGNCHANYIIGKGIGGTPLYECDFFDGPYTNFTHCNNNPPDVFHESFAAVGVFTTSAGPFVKKDQWYFITITYDGKTAKYFLNGALVASGNYSNTFSNSYDLFLGRNDPIQSPFWLNGVLDEVRIYNRALNSAEINALYKEPNPIPTNSCNSYLFVPAELAGVQIGNLTITGDQLTVEAVFNRTEPYTRGYLYAGDLVSKHDGPANVNYLLRPNDAEITTSFGYFHTPDICPIELNKTYHVAMVYDGKTLRFYRNGYLMSSVPAFGNLVTNNLLTTIGSAPNRTFTDIESLRGFINEVRIWNVARTSSQIQTFINTPLPSPTTQSGLQAYYQFNSLTNLQGNPAWNGTIVDGATINQTNPTCTTFTPDSCSKIKPILPLVGFNVVDTVCLNTPINLINTSNGVTTYNWNFCSADINGTMDPFTTAPYCSTTSVNILSSTNASPLPVFYSTPGKYNICLTINEGLPTQASFCKPIVVLPPSSALDFSFVQDNCNPKMVAFHNKSVPIPGITFSYDFGDGSFATQPNLITSTKYYDNFNNYTVTLTNTSGCADTIQKIIPVYLKKDSLIINNDTTICKYSSIQLSAINASSYCWKPGIGLSDSTSQHPVASPKNTTTYYLNAQIMGPNLVTNGDFSSGNAGFTSDYHDSINGYHTGTFTVDTTAAIWHPFLSRCHDHTSGDGKMMIVNGAYNQGAAIWKQTINNIQPNTDYLFSVWLQSLSISNPAQIKFYVNGNPIGGSFNAILDTCIWQQPLSTWNSGNNTTATISIVNQDTIGAGNDFALDDISFSATAVINDSVTIKVDAPLQSPNIDTTICLGQSVELNANLANSYQWSASPFLSNLVIQNPIARPTLSSVFNVNRYNTQGCYVTDTFKVEVLTIKASLDFSFSENICNPLSIQFKNESTNSNAYLWSFGDGNMSSSVNPQNKYNNYGSYKVTLQNTDGCIDSVTKYVSVNVRIDSLITTKDTSICGGSPFQLQSLPALEYCWYPTFGLSDPTIPNPIATTNVPTTYYVNAKVVGNNLIVNGDFSQGSTGFTTDYYYAFPNTIEEQYYVGTNAQLWNGGMSACGDHTTGKGNYLMINGANLAGKIAWEEKNITIQPNTNYAFSAWVEALFPEDPAILQFSINGHKIGQTFQAPGPNTTCLWRQFYVVWNSGTNKTADISLINLNTIKNGNDFGLDDISFSKLDIIKDSINIILKQTPVVTIINNDTSICERDSFQLRAIGATQFEWTPSNSLSNHSVFNPIAFPSVNTKYKVTGTNSQGCSAIDSINLVVNPLPSFNITKDTSICLGNSIGLSVQSSTVNAYSWYPQTYLSSSIDPNPFAKPTETIKYFVSVTDQDNFCTDRDSIKITVLPLPIVQTRTDTSICLQSTTTLFTSTNADHVRWYPVFGLSDSTVLSPIDTAIFLGANTYWVTAFSNKGCISTDKVTITGLALPTVRVEKDSFSICSKKSVQLNIKTSPITNLKYNWMPVEGLNLTNIPNPIATPDNSTTYHILITATNNCKAEDSVYLFVKQLPQFTIEPANSAICLGDSILIAVKGGDQFHWFDSQIFNQDSSANYVHPIATTTFKVSVKDTLCQIAIPLYTTVTVNYPPVISIQKSNDIDCFHTTATLTARGGTKYQWAPIDSIVAINRESIVVAPNQSAVYTVKAFSDNGCVTDSSIRVNVVKGDISKNFPAANAFTPTINSNNCFGVKEWGHLDNLQLSIFNRAGQRIFYTTSLDGCWDGVVNGKMQDAGTYIYEIKATTLCGLIYRKGTVVLIR